MRPKVFPTRTIGILGGMGPRATVQFEQLLLQYLSGTDQQLPAILTVNDGSIPDRSRYLLGRGSDPVPQMQRNLDILQQAGARLIALPCNTACAPAIFNRLRPAPDVQLVNLPEEVGKALRTEGYTSVYILATEGTIRAGIYQNVCSQARVSYAAPDIATQRLVNKVITAVKAGNMPMARMYAVQVAAAVRRAGSQAVLLGCTELPLVSAFLAPRQATAIDTLAVLARAVSRYTTKQSKGEQYDPRPVYA